MGMDILLMGALQKEMFVFINKATYIIKKKKNDYNLQKIYKLNFL